MTHPVRRLGAAVAAATLTATGLVALGASPASAAGDDLAWRVFGKTRIQTAVRTSQQTFLAAGDPPDPNNPKKTQAGAVLLARSDQFPDGLAGVALAGKKQAPILITPSTALDPGAGTEIDRVLGGSGKVYILGGTGALSAAVESAVQAKGYTTERLGGANRFETAVKIANEVGPATHILLTTGLNFPDALSAGPAAATKTSADGSTTGVVVLTADTAMPPETRAYLNAHPDAVRYAIGGQAAAAAGTFTTTDLVGANRYETSRKVADQFFATGPAWKNPPTVGISDGTNFPDALGGGAWAAHIGAPMMFTEPRSNTLNAVTRDFLTDNHTRADRVCFYGGSSLLTASALDQALNAIQD